ncbi:hypothetical protein [Algibacter pectinivorans]|uniref:LTXXQ motif family protein n=1 Tax=Algibacter pectinivorans TaxID=870482 RepID=A0A1I1PUY1_9FLAO|nr:hypothetical protein [Algibacter pectinivorans]SFD13497.1 hypothetical protein SAMN04487987_104251 [Algibacter pectinivorans]
MKKLILIAVALFALQVSAQEEKKEKHNRGERGERMMNLSAEEIATLQTKKMTLALDLTESQQNKVQKLNLENATKRKEMMENRKAKKENGDAIKPTKEERLAMANARLDHKIAEKAKMKDILNDEQYAKWEKMQARMGKKGKRKGDGKKKGQKRGYDEGKI